MKNNQWKVGTILNKPWGKETYIGGGPNCALWELIIQPGNSTSKHYHSNKNTYFICLAGYGNLLIGDTQTAITPGDFYTIPIKIPHRMMALGDKPLLINEFESSSDKFDITRLDDSYGRQGKEFLYGCSVDTNFGTSIQLGFDEQNEKAMESSIYGGDSIYVCTDLGISRELYTPSTIKSKLLSGTKNLAAGLEIYVPSNATIKKATNLNTPLSKFILGVDSEAKIRSNNTFTGNTRIIHGNVWMEYFFIISGKMKMIEFNPSKNTEEKMKSNQGGLYNITQNNIDKTYYRKNSLVVKELNSGDIHLSKPGVAHGQQDCEDCVYIAYIFKPNEFWTLAERFWGINSEKWKLNKKIEEVNCTQDPMPGSSYWGLYAEGQTIFRQRS